MEILYIDPLAGISGDMMLGALVDLGADFGALQDKLATLGVTGFSLQRSPAIRHMIAGTKVDVAVDDPGHHHRRLPDLLKIVRQSPLSEWVRDRSCEALTRLAEGESHVHRMPLDEVTLHEVGGLDCLVDIVGSVQAVELLGIDTLLGGPVSVGAGFVTCAHGVMPLPAPGTLAILGEYPIRRTQFGYEMTTPTGAALLWTLVNPVVSPLVMKPLAVGYGAGTRDMPNAANLLRVVRAEIDLRYLPREASFLMPNHSHDHHHGHDHEHGHSHEHGHEHGHQHVTA